MTEREIGRAPSAQLRARLAAFDAGASEQFPGEWYRVSDELYNRELIEDGDGRAVQGTGNGHV